VVTKPAPGVLEMDGLRTRDGRGLLDSCVILDMSHDNRSLLGALVRNLDGDRAVLRARVAVRARVPGQGGDADREGVRCVKTTEVCCCISLLLATIMYDASVLIIVFTDWGLNLVDDESFPLECVRTLFARKSRPIYS
jgi:hypothetical protein